MQEVKNMVVVCPLCGQVHESALIERSVTADCSVTFQTCGIKGIIYLPEDQQRIMEEFANGEGMLTGY